MTAATAIIELDSRQAILAHVNLRPQFEGDEAVPCVDAKFEGITLTKDELNTLLGDKHAHDALFNTAKKGAVIEPMFKQFEAFKLKDKFEDCSVSLAFGLSEEFYEFEDVKLASVRLQPLAGGMTAMTVTMQHELEDTDIVGNLAEYLTRECSIAIVIGKKAADEKKAKDKQGKLALNEGTDKADKPKNAFGEGEAPLATH